jgi:large subunit ribosomal protein L4
VPKKVRKLALKMALSSKFQEKQLVVLDQFGLEEVKTKKFVEVLQGLNFGKTLIVTDTENPNLELSSRNVPSVKVLRCEGLNVYDVLNCHTLVLLEPSIEGIERRLA